MKIKINENKFGQLNVQEGDSLVNVAREFAKTYKLDKLNELNVEKIINDTYVKIKKENLVKSNE